MGAGAGMIAVAAVTAAAAAYGYYQQDQALKTQSILEESSMILEREQFAAQSQEKALTVASNFRQSLAAQLALASQRGGGGSVARQFAGGALSSLNKDLIAVQQGVNLNDLRTTQMIAQSRAGIAGAKAQNLMGLGIGLANAAGSYYLGSAQIQGAQAGGSKLG